MGCFMTAATTRWPGSIVTAGRQGGAWRCVGRNGGRTPHRHRCDRRRAVANGRGCEVKMKGQR
ncbi:hypothetical protein A2U01_0086432, partial [Trifolium medium]|nr:hypothetical protein [Trifolium medium]